MSAAVAERWILWIAVVALLVVAGRSLVLSRTLSASKSPSLAPSAIPGADAFAATEGGALRAGAARWERPARESGWMADLFTPPPVLRDPMTGRLRLPPTGGAPVVVDDGPMLELMAIGDPVFRVQLIGSVGPPEDGVGLFELWPAGGTRLGRSGDVWADLEIAVLRVEVTRRAERLPSQTTLSQWEARATLLDRRTQDIVVLSSREQRAGAPDRVRLRSLASDQEWEQQLGASVALDGVTWRLVAVRLEPGEAEIAEERSDGTSRVHRLRLAGR